MDPVNTDHAAWLRRRPARGPVRLRLFCFPSAGAGAALFHAWADALPPDVELCPVQLPGREDRIREPLLRHLPTAVHQLAASVEPFRERPFALFGHSMGALVAFETARALRASGAPAPLRLFCSACGAPEAVRARAPVYGLPDEEFLRHVRRLGGVPAPILDDAEMMRLFMPILRADLELHQTYAYRDEPPFDFPITAFGGTEDDEAPPNALDGWRRHTTGDFERLEFPSGHFFIHAAREPFLRALAAALRRLMRDAGI